MSTIPEATIHAICSGHFVTVFDVLGPHVVASNGKREVVIRAFLPRAQAASVIELTRQRRSVQLSEAKPLPMQKVHPSGFFELTFAKRVKPFRYRLLVETSEGKAEAIEDPYAFPPLLTDLDLHLFGEGKHFRTYEKLGAHLREVGGVQGTHFAVWAPNAERVSVIGSFNQWDGRAHGMYFHRSVGLWELFVPGLEAGVAYKYEVLVQGTKGKMDKSDPYGFSAELRPSTASIVYDIDRYAWQDGAWMLGRAKRQALDQPLSIYEVHLGSWKRKSDEPTGWLNYRELAHELVAYVKQMGYTHIELLPIAEHPYDGSWGYQVTGYYAPTSRFGTPTDFMYFVDYCHQHEIGVILDWVPAHFPKDGHSLNYFDGTHLYAPADPRRSEHQDWGTLIFDYGRREVRNFLIANALFWLDKYHIDGLRVDAVASMLYLDYSRQPGEWLPNKYGGRENLEAVAFLRRFNEQIHEEYPGVLTIAEESTSWPMVSRPLHLGGLGFDLKWNMGWMHDLLKYMSLDPIFRRFNHNHLTFSLWYAFNENFVLPLSHDEVVHLKRALLEKMPGDEWRKFANLRAFYAYMLTHPGKKLLFMGGEFGQRREWSEARSLDWVLLTQTSHRQLQAFVQALHRLYHAESSLYEVDFDAKGFQWIDFHDIEQSVISFMRLAKDKDNFVIVVCNFTPVPRYGYRVGVPAAGVYRELLNSDAEQYGGSNVLNLGDIRAEETVWQSQPCSIVLTLPPLATVVLKCVERKVESVKVGEGSASEATDSGVS